MDEIKLKPCPFCGCERVWMRAVEYDKCINIIRCPDCNMELTTPTWDKGHKFNNRKQTAETWNTRVSGMIPCSERMPETHGFYLVYMKELDRYQVVLYTGDADPSKPRSWHGAGDCTHRITHWMLLPDRPKGDDTNG